MIDFLSCRSRLAAMLVVGALSVSASRTDAQMFARDYQKGWKVQTFRSAAGDTTLLASAYSSEAIFTNAAEVRPRLIIRCFRGELSAYLQTGLILFIEPGDLTPVRVRFDGQLPPERASWRINETGEAAVASDAARLVSVALRADSVLRIEIRPIDQNPRVARIELAGMRAQLAPLLERCPVPTAGPGAPVAQAEFTLSADTVLTNIDVNRSARVRRGVAPKYPDRERSMDREGFVYAEFVIDTMGRAEIGTFQVAKSAGGEAFVDSVRDALRQMWFHPGEVRGQKVRQRVEMPFTFTLR